MRNDKYFASYDKCGNKCIIDRVLDQQSEKLIDLMRKKREVSSRPNSEVALSIINNRINKQIQRLRYFGKLKGDKQEVQNSVNNKLSNKGIYETIKL